MRHPHQSMTRCTCQSHAESGMFNNSTRRWLSELTDRRQKKTKKGQLAKRRPGSGKSESDGTMSAIDMIRPSGVATADASALNSSSNCTIEQIRRNSGQVRKSQVGCKVGITAHKTLNRRKSRALSFIGSGTPAQPRLRATAHPAQPGAGRM